MGFNRGVFTQKLVSLVHAVAIYLLPLSSFISTYIFRLQIFGKSALKKNGGEINFLEAEDECIVEEDFNEFTGFDDNGVEEEEETEVFLKFKFPSFEEGKYEFNSGKSLISTFIDELENFPVKENTGNGNSEFCENEEGSLDGKLERIYGGTGSFNGKGKTIVVFDTEENEKSEAIEFTEKSEEKTHFLQKEDEFQGNHDESRFFSEKSSPVVDSDSESTSFDNKSSVMSSLVDSHSGDGFLSDGDFGEELDDGNDKTETDSEISSFEESPELSDVESDILEELKKLEEHTLQNPNDLSSDFLSEKDFKNDSDSKKVSTFDDEETMNGGDNLEETKSKDPSILSDSGDGNKLESLWEHQELMEQLKMELKKVRATGLPTILEESESPKIMDDLKPWKIDEKLQREDCIGELHKFYKSYREKMRKFDILNYQKMYAMGFLQLKDPLQSGSKQKPVPPTLKSLVSQNFWLFKHKVHGSDPMKKFVKELQGDLEVVYVGHMCLSWEFLHWQHEKALDLWDSDPRGIRQYNEVAGEFQQFQVLMQRFIENEPFQGPRVQNYVKSRCTLRNLLQVPVIREDNLKNRRKAMKRDTDEYVITSDTLVEIVEESIRIFWQFVRADKDASTTAINSHKKTPELQNPEDLKLLLEVRKNLQKKERKLKDLLRSENCILRKFRQCREDDDSDQVLYFFAQVDMKLVSRVLNMSKITRDQLSWCDNKLGRIRFVNRKMHVERSFLLFPC